MSNKCNYIKMLYNNSDFWKLNWTLHRLKPVECSIWDNDFMNDSDLIDVHTNDNTATVLLKTKDLIKIIQKHGNTVNIVQI